jgi:hypothetical protein
LALTAVLFFLFPDPFRGTLAFWQGWFWLILGTLAESVIVLATLSDADIRAGLFMRPIRGRVDVERLGADHEDAILRALARREEIELFLQRTRDRQARRAIVTVADDISRWILAMNALAHVLRRCRDRDRLQLKRRGAQGAGADQAATGGPAGPSRGPDRSSSLQSTEGAQMGTGASHSTKQVERAERQIESDLEALHDVYVQLQLAVAGGVDGSRVRRLDRQVQARVQALQEFAQALECLPDQTSRTVP